MNSARLDAIIASLRANGSSAPVSPHDLVTGILLLADIRDAERALREADVLRWHAVALDMDTTADHDKARAANDALRALGVDP